MSGYKAMADLAILVIVAGVIIGLVLLFTYVPLLSRIVVIKAEARLLLDIEDQGSSLVMLMGLDNGTDRYAEMIGGLRAKNSKDYVSEEHVTRVLGLINSKAAVYDERGNLIFGETGTTQTAEIALPGGLKGRMGLK